MSPKEGKAGSAWGAESDSGRAANSDEHQKVATKGSDPVVVSLAAAAASPRSQYSQQAPHQDHLEEEVEVEEDDFDPQDFQIYMADEALDEGVEVVMDPPPQGFREEYPTANPQVTEATVLDHLATVAQ